MSRARVAVLAVAIALAGALLLRQAAPGASARPSEAPARVAPPPAPAPARSVPPVPAPVRDIFEYMREEDADSPPTVRITRAAALPPPPSLAEAAPAPPAGPRLVGILRQGGVLRAALSLDGEVVVAGVGDRAGSYIVDAIDAEDGVRLRDAAGTTLTLAPPD